MNKEEIQKAGGSRGSGDNMVAKLDSSIMSCPICSKPFRLPLNKCTNGHVICSKCCGKNNEKCPECSLPLAAFRCIPLEAIIETAMVSCPYQEFGCPAVLQPNMKNIHMNECMYAPCSCPLPACGFTGPINSFSAHFDASHLSAYEQKRFTLDEPFEVQVSKEKPVYYLRGEHGLHFLLLNNIDQRGNYLSIVRLMPGTASEFFRYELSVDKSPTWTMNLTGSLIHHVRKWTDYVPNVALFVPDFMFFPPFPLTVKVCIKHWYMPNKY